MLRLSLRLSLVSMFVAGVLHCGDDGGGSSSGTTADGGTPEDGATNTNPSDTGANDAEPEGPFTTWRLTVDPPDGGLNLVSSLSTHGANVYFAGEIDDGFSGIEARRLSDGSPVWRVPLRGASQVRGFGDNLLVYAQPGGPPDLELRRVSDGSLVWSKKLGSLGGIDINADGITIASQTTFGLASDEGWTVRRLDLAGNPLWSKTSNPTDYIDSATSLRVTPQAVYAVANVKSSGPPYSRWYIEKRASQDGAFAWGKTYSLAALQTNNTPVSVDSDDDAVYVAGYMTMSPTAGDAGVAERTVVVKLSAATGDEQWSTTVPFGAHAQGFGRAPQLVVAADGVYVGDAERGGEGTIARLSKTDGAAVWSMKGFRQPTFDLPISVARSGAALLTGGSRLRDPDGGNTTDRVWLVEKREAATGAFSATNHLELTQ